MTADVGIGPIGKQDETWSCGCEGRANGDERLVGHIIFSAGDAFGEQSKRRGVGEISRIKSARPITPAPQPKGQHMPIGAELSAIGAERLAHIGRDAVNMNVQLVLASSARGVDLSG